jgi:predicted ArsR family transcriptional regulator
MSITRDDWLKAMEEAGAHDDRNDPSAVTIIEFAAMFGLPRDAARRRLNALEQAGKATVTRKYGPRRDGKMFRMMAWKLETPKRKKR